MCSSDLLALALVEDTGGLEPRPLPRALRDELGRRLFEGTPAAPRLRPGVAERAMRGLEPLVPESARAELRRLVDVTLTRLVEEVGAAFLQEGRVDSIASLVLPMEGTPR